MIKKYIVRQSGLTLIEVLAVLAISTIIISIISTALVSAFKHNNTTQAHIDLRQEANLLVTKLRTEHQKSKNPSGYKLCYKDGNINISLKSGEIEPLASENVILKGIDNNKILMSYGNSQITESNSCDNPTLIDDLEKPLFVTLTLVDKEQKEFEIDTIIDRLNTRNSATSSSPVIPPSAIFDDIDDFNDLEKENGNDYNPVTFLTNGCTVTGNSLSLQDTYAPTWGTYCPISTVKGGSLYLKNGLTIFSKLYVDHDLYNEGRINTEHNALIHTSGNLRFDKNAVIKSSSSLTVGKNAFIKDEITIQENTQMSIGGSARFDKKMTFTSNGSLSVKENLFTLSDIVLENNSRITVNGNAFLNSLVKIKGDSAVFVAGDLKALGDLDLQSDTNLIISGDAIFDGKLNPNTQWDKGKVCVRGKATFKNSPTHYKVVENATSCDNQPNGTIYVLNQ